jgi:hypothetical protein
VLPNSERRIADGATRTTRHFEEDGVVRIVDELKNGRKENRE